MNTSTGEDRLAGFIDGLAEFNSALPHDLRAFGDFSEASGYRAMSDLLDHSPDAVFAASDGMALGAMRRIHEEGLSVPNDIAVIGFDGFTQGETSEPPLTTLEQPVSATGSKAVEMLHTILGGRSTPVGPSVLPVRLIRRESA